MTPVMSSHSGISMVFMGSDPLALPSLELIWGRRNDFPIRAVYTQPDRPHGRGRKIRPSRVKTWALERGIAVQQPASFSASAISLLRELNPDLILVMAYGHILPQPVLDVPALGIYNLHLSLLPKLRGASPVESAIVSGERVTGISLMRLVLQLDAGPIIDQEVVPIDEEDTGGSLLEKLSAASPVLLERNLEGLSKGRCAESPQSESEATYCRMMIKKDGQLDFAKPAAQLARRIRGLNPWPGCFARLGDTVLKIGHATHRRGMTPGNFGQVLSMGAEGLEVATGDGVLILKSLQKPGGRLLPVNEFARGFLLQPGDCFAGGKMYPLVSKKPISQKRFFQLDNKTC